MFVLTQIVRKNCLQYKLLLNKIEREFFSSTKICQFTPFLSGLIWFSSFFSKKCQKNHFIRERTHSSARFRDFQRRNYQTREEECVLGPILVEQKNFQCKQIAGCLLYYSMYPLQILTCFANPGHIYLWAAYNVVSAVITD